MEKIDNHNKTHGKMVKFTLLSFVTLLVGAVFYVSTLTKKIDRAQKHLEIEQLVQTKKIDSVSKKVDSRYTSFDNKFLMTNNIVVDENDNKIGEIYIYTNDSLIDLYYNKKGRRKTQFYYNMKSRELKVFEKE